MELGSIQTGKVEKPAVAFKKNVQREIALQNGNESKDSKALEKTLIALGAIGLGTIAAVSAYKKGSSAGFEKGIGQGIIKGFQGGIRDGLESMKNMDLAGFKKVGKFEKGKAFINGKEFSGAIYTPKGHKLIYRDGYLSQSIGARSQKYYSDGKLYCATYKPIAVGDVEKVVVKSGADGTREYKKFLADYADRHKPLEEEIITTIKPDGSITRRYTNLKKEASITGSEYKYDKIVDLKTKKCTGIEMKNVKKAEANAIIHKEQSFVDGKKVTKEFENGKLIGSYTTEYNPKTGLAVKTSTSQCGTDYVVRNPKNDTLISTRYGGRSIYLKAEGDTIGFFESLYELKSWIARQKINVDAKVLEEIANKIA